MVSIMAAIHLFDVCALFVVFDAVALVALIVRAAIAVVVALFDTFAMFALIDIVALVAIIVLIMIIA
jgi:hypothetical protein